MIGESFESVLAAARLGAEWAWRVLYEETAPRLHSYLSFRGADDPEGLVGEVFLRGAKGIDDFQGDEHNFRSWLFSIAHARLVDERQMRDRRQTDPTDSADLEGIADPTGVESVALERISSERLVDLFSVLAPDQRDVLTLRIIGDLSVAETASVLDKSVASVKVLQHRGLNRLRELATEKGVTK